jgi:hypothetical protein
MRQLLMTLGFVPAACAAAAGFVARRGDLLAAIGGMPSLVGISAMIGRYAHKAEWPAP